MTSSKPHAKAKQDAKGAPADTDESLATKVALRKRADAKVPVTAELPDAEPPEKLSTLAGEYIGLSIASGLVIGLVLGALFPRSAARKLAKRSGALAAVASEIGVAYAAQALGKAGSTAREGRDRAVDMGEVLAERSANARARATRLIGDGTGMARGTGSALVRKAAEIVAKARS